MPELPEVETVKNGIAAFVGNAEIVSIDIRNRCFREKIPADIESKIVNAKIVDYTRVGKYIVIKLDNNLSLIWHLGMSGRIKTVECKPLKLEKHDHIVLETTHGCLVYNDPRRFGLFTYYQTNKISEFKGFRHMGADPFDKKLNKKYLFELLQKKKTPIKTALLDQTIVNGIGNIYASEILYASQISPLRSADRISLSECDSIIENTRAVLQKAINNGGSTLRDYHKPDGSLGYFQNLHCVYNKTGMCCPNCTCDINKTGGIRRITQSGRSTFYCPTLQK